MAGQIGMDAVSNHIPENQWPARSTVHRPVREQAIITAPSVCELETRPSGCGHRCLHTGLELPSREIVCKPTLGLIGRVLSLIHLQGVQELVLVAPVWRPKHGIQCYFKCWSEHQFSSYSY